MKSLYVLRDFLRQEGASGFVLIAAAILGMALANSPLSDNYREALSSGFKIETSYFYLSLTVAKTINYLLMSIFFLLVGMEIKRELISGHLSSLKKAAAPFAAAIGGMLIPALIYLAIVKGEAARGWAIPMATDIALAVGVLSIMGSRIPFAMKAFLLALAVIDDIGAIIIIALFYSEGVSLAWIISGLLTFGFIYLFMKFGYRSKFMITIAIALLWYSFYRSGIHPTIAGVLLGFALPESEHLEERIHPWSSFLIVPVFALANTGIEISKSAIAAASNSAIALGIFLGMVLGKPIGILLFTKVASILNIAETPDTKSKYALPATGSAAGIGFTVAIFISELAFVDQSMQQIAVMTIIFASVVSGLISVTFSRFSPKEEVREE